VAAAEACHGALEPPPVMCHTRTLLTACMIEAHPVNVFEFPTEPLEAALSAATAPFLRTLGRLVVEASLLTPEEELERPLHMLLPLGLLGELRPQVVAFEAAHAAWTAVDLPRVVRRLSLALLALAQARGTAVAAVDADLVAQIDTSVARLRAQLARLRRRVPRRVAYPVHSRAGGECGDDAVATKGVGGVGRSQRVRAAAEHRGVAPPFPRCSIFAARCARGPGVRCPSVLSPSASSGSFQFV
jgi:hypothetical protein